jgi:acyl-CoA dehydrogenase
LLLIEDNMISFTLNETLNGVREFLHYFAENEVRPVSLAADRAGGFTDDFLRKVKEMGISMGALSKPSVEEDIGSLGSEGGKRRKPKTVNRLSAIASEELSWGDGAFMLSLPGPGLGGPPVQFMGTPEQRERFLSIFNRDNEPRFGAYGLTEPGAGSDVAGIRTRARKDGQHWVLDGTKCYITNGGRAEWVVIFATIDATQGRNAHRAFVVEKGTPGFRVGKIEQKMGLRASETAELVLEECRVPAANLLGGEGLYESKQGFLGAMKTFDTTRPLVAAMAVGIGRAALERATEHAKASGLMSMRSVRAVQLRDALARAERRLEVARLLVWRASWMADEGVPNAREASMSKAHAATAALEATATAVQVMGAAGCAGDSLVEKWFRDIKVFDIFEGTGQIQRVVIAKRLLEGLKSF